MRLPVAVAVVVLDDRLKRLRLVLFKVLSRVLGVRRAMCPKGAAWVLCVLFRPRCRASKLNPNMLSGGPVGSMLSMLVYLHN